jgi:hypothetical protein
MPSFSDLLEVKVFVLGDVRQSWRQDHGFLFRPHRKLSFSTLVSQL